MCLLSKLLAVGTQQYAKFVLEVSYVRVLRSDCSLLIRGESICPDISGYKVPYSILKLIKGPLLYSNVVNGANYRGSKTP
jgi:hypothetical protein